MCRESRYKESYNVFQQKLRGENCRLENPSMPPLAMMFLEASQAAALIHFKVTIYSDIEVV